MQSSCSCRYFLTAFLGQPSAADGQTLSVQTASTAIGGAGMESQRSFSTGTQVGKLQRAICNQHYATFCMHWRSVYWPVRWSEFLKRHLGLLALTFRHNPWCPAAYRTSMCMFP